VHIAFVVSRHEEGSALYGATLTAPFTVSWSKRVSASKYLNKIKCGQPPPSPDFRLSAVALPLLNPCYTRVTP